MLIDKDGMLTPEQLFQAQFRRLHEIENGEWPLTDVIASYDGLSDSFGHEAVAVLNQ